MVTQDKLIEFLKEGKVTVTFTKKDGTPRVMNCTLNKDLLLVHAPVATQEESTKPTRKQNPNQVRVYDLDAHAWRSFNYSTLTEVSLPTVVNIYTGAESQTLDPASKTIGGILVLATIVYLLSCVS